MSEPENDLINQEEVTKKNPLKLNRCFAKNIVKHTQDNNRIRTTSKQKEQRKFVNEERKKHTRKNLSVEANKSKTMYSDYVSQKLEEKTARKTSVMFDQMKKLVKEAAQYDQAMSQKEVQSLHGTFLGNVRKPKVTVDKTLLRNHLQHTSVHNRLKEEGEMWDKLDKEKKRQVRTKPRFGMYADAEPGRSITVRLPSDEPDDEIEYEQKSKHQKTPRLKLQSNKNKSRLYSDRTYQSDGSDEDVKSMEEPESPEINQWKSRIVRKVSNSKSNRKVLLNGGHGNQQNITKASNARKRKFREEFGKIKNSVPTRSLYADVGESVTRLSGNTGERWGHDGFFSLSGEESQAKDAKKRKIKEPVYISSDEDSNDEKKLKRISSKISQKNGKSHFVSKDTLKGSIHDLDHKEKSSTKPRLVYATKKQKKKRRKYSSSSSSLSSASSSSSSSSDSSLSSSDDSDHYVTKKKSKKKGKKKKR